MRVLSWVGAASLLSITACGQLEQGEAPPQPVIGPPTAPAFPPGPPRVAILIPLTGPNADAGQSILKAAQLALSRPGSPVLDIQDTGGDPNRAGAEAQQAIAAGDRLIIGPLTAPETAAVGAATSSANIGVLAFTSDAAAAAPGVWTLGLTPGQQVRRLVAAARDDGRQHIAALLPEGALGDALQSALMSAATDAGLEPPTIQRSTGGLAGFTDALKILSNYAERRGDLESRIKALQQSNDPASRAQAAELAARPVQPPPFDALLLGESGDTLAAAAEVLPAYDVTEPQVRVMGPALWAQQVHHLGALAGAWYAALDPDARGQFVTAYVAHYGAPPHPLADYGFDAAAVARVLAQGNDFSTAALTREEGFTGVDGAFVLLPDGHVRRALAVWQIDAGGGSHIVSPAPQDASLPGT